VWLLSVEDSDSSTLARDAVWFGIEAPPFWRKPGETTVSSVLKAEERVSETVSTPQM
jgi:hypothetical protein